jgi:hypothetical protein
VKNIERSRRYSAFFASLLVVATWLAAASAASASPKLELKMSSAVQVVTPNENGEASVTYTPGDSAQPRDRVLYTIEYRNAGDETAKKVSMVGAISPNAAFVQVVDGGSAAEIRFSADGGKTFATPPFKFSTRDADGKSVTREATADDYTHIRFTLTGPVAPEASGHVGYLVQIR